MKASIRIWCGMALLTLLLGVARAAAAEYAEAILRDGKATAVKGTVELFDKERVVIKTPNGVVNVPWTDMTGSSAFGLRSRLMDKQSATEWLELGKLAWGLGAREQAKIALGKAASLDPAVKPQADAVLRSEAGATLKTALKGPGDAPAAGSQVSGGATTKADANRGELFAGVGKTTGKDGEVSDAVPVITYGRLDMMKNAAAMNAARKQFVELAATKKIKYTELQTSHFVIFADNEIDKMDQAMLKIASEQAYIQMAKMFNFQVNEQLYLGKVPVWVFAGAGMLKDVGQEYDAVTLPEGATGYYYGAGDGSGHLALAAPEKGEEAKKLWQRAFTRQFALAFLDRWKSNRIMPPWLSRGIGEAAGFEKPGDPDVRKAAKEIADLRATIAPLFTNANPDGEWMPVMQTLVETLLVKDAGNFVLLCKSIKEGMAPADALQKHYSWMYADLERNWRTFLTEGKLVEPAKGATGGAATATQPSKALEKPGPVRGGDVTVRGAK